MISVRDESKRLAALRQHEPLDGEQDRIFHNIVGFVAKSFDVRAAAISLIDEDRQVFFEKVGVEDSWSPRDSAICAHTIAVDNTVVILDAGSAAKWRDTPLVAAGPRIRFYVGVPLRSTGEPIGTLCLLDPRPRTCFSAEERLRLEGFANVVAELLETRRLRLAGQASEMRFERMAATCPDAMLVADRDGRIKFWNASSIDMFGYTFEEAKQLRIVDLLPPPLRSRRNGFSAMVEAVPGEPQEIAVLAMTGEVKIVDASFCRWREGNEEMHGAILRDVSARKATEDKLFRLAHLDGLTGLPNRTLLRLRLRDALASGRQATVLLLDIDGFKDVNDTLGHLAGDEILKAAAVRFGECVDPCDTVSRLGGDEFAILLAGCGDPLEAAAVANRVIDAITKPFPLDEETVCVGVSIGIALASDRVRQADELLSQADLALYRAKADGRHCHRFFLPHMQEDAANRRRYAQDFHRAVEMSEFVLHYQPQVRLSDGAMIGAEALLRWQHPDFGLLQPAAFLPALAASRHAATVGRWVIETACRQAARWRRMGHDGFRMAVNACAAHFRSGDVASIVFTALEEAGLPGANFELEITETIVIGYDDHVLRPLRTLRDAGVGIAFDDYGTGYASLSLLKHFPLTRLKIDRSFVHEMSDVADVTLIRAIMHLAHGFRLQVIAEGIETQDQLERLRAKGCNEGQGFLFSRPVSAEDFERRFVLPRGPGSIGWRYVDGSRWHLESQSA